MKSELNLIGLCCSVPHLMIYNKLKKMNKGDILIVITDDLTVVQRDVIPLAQKFGCKMDIKKEGDEYKIELIM